MKRRLSTAELNKISAATERQVYDSESEFDSDDSLKYPTWKRPAQWFSNGVQEHTGAPWKVARCAFDRRKFNLYLIIFLKNHMTLIYFRHYECCIQVS